MKLFNILAVLVTLSANFPYNYRSNLDRGGIS
jgi:hypothetical protein